MKFWTRKNDKSLIFYKQTMLNENPQITETNEKDQEKHYIEAGFKEDEYGPYYEVQKDDWTETLYSIFLELLKRGKVDAWVKLLIRNIFLEYVNKKKFFWIIKQWDRIDINEGDKNSFELQVWKEIFTLNTYNQTIIKQ